MGNIYVINMSALGSLRQLAATTLRKNVILSNQISKQIVPKRTVVYKDTGAILEEPEQVRFGVVKVLAVVLPFLYTGATMSKSGAAFLEENDIFVPDDDDD